MTICLSRKIDRTTLEDWAQYWVCWEFIEDERNNLLKAYRFGVEVDEHGLFHDALDMDGHQLLREAIYWWRDQLEEIERDLSLKSRSFDEIAAQP